MNKVLRALLLVLALAGFLLFFTFNIQTFGPAQSVTVGFNLSPWLRWSRLKGMERMSERTELNFMSWSTAGLGAGLLLLFLRSRVKP
jgi:hypothetical protein